jgi:hypothetical protein
LDDPRVGARQNKKARTSSAMLPKLTLSSPPIVLPACSAACSVARRSQSASTAIAIPPVTNTSKSASVR